MHYKPVKLKKTAYIDLGLLIFGLILFFVSDFFPMPFVFQIFGLLMFTLSIQILQRYILSDFTYIIDDSEPGCYVMDIIKAQGKKKIKVCSVELDKCCLFGPEDAHKLTISNSFDYKQNIFIKQSLVLLYWDGDAYSKITIEPDKVFESELTKRLTSKL